nr:sodium-dependent phosphate transport protein 3 isoform X5 [Oryctolagus cuniculus]
MDEKSPSRKGPDFCSLRYGLALIMHFSNFTMITQRVSLSIAIIAMVNSTQRASPSNASFEDPLADTLSNPSKPIKELNTRGMAWTGQFTIWAKWAPPLERSKLTSIAGSGNQWQDLSQEFSVSLSFSTPTPCCIMPEGAAFGSFFILCVGGLISQALGWPFIFYIFGSIGCVCCLLWFTVIYDDPSHHPCISAREKEYIVSSLAHQSSSPRRSVPIKAMVRCLPLWAIFTGFFSHFWLCTIIITYLPTYISTVLHVNIRDSGVLSSLPFIAASSCTILGGQLADFLLSRSLLRLITVRKLFSSLGLLLPSLCAVALPFVASSYVTTIILLILIPGTSNLCDSGFIINTLDVAPRYASFLMGISRGFGLIAGIVSSTATGFLISQDSETGWRNVFFLSAAVNMLGLVFYLTFGQAEIQDWAKERTLTRL